MSVTLNRYYTIHLGHQKCFYFNRKHDYLKTFYSENNLSSNADVIHIFLQYLGKVWKLIFMSQRPIGVPDISAVPSDPQQFVLVICRS